MTTRRRSGPTLTCPAPGSPGPSTRTPGRRACSCPSRPGRLTRTGSRSPGRRRRCRRIRCWPPSSTRSPARTGPGSPRLSDDQLIGVIAAVRRLESRVAWYALTAVEEFAARWGGEVAGAEFAADQLACELHLTSRSAAVQLDYATAVAERLPRCLAALHAGLLHPVHLRIIEEETQILSTGGRRHRRCGAGGDGGGADVREAPLRRAPAGPETGPRGGGTAEGRRAAQRARADVPGAVRERRDDRPGTADR